MRVWEIEPQKAKMPLKVQKRMSLTTNTIEENRLVSPRRDSLEKY